MNSRITSITATIKIQNSNVYEIKIYPLGGNKNEIIVEFNNLIFSDEYKYFMFINDKSSEVVIKHNKSNFDNISKLYGKQILSFIKKNMVIF
jgi:hypothetical protein